MFPKPTADPAAARSQIRLSHFEFSFAYEVVLSFFVLCFKTETILSIIQEFYEKVNLFDSNDIESIFSQFTF